MLLGGFGNFTLFFDGLWSSVGDLRFALRSIKRFLQLSQILSQFLELIFYTSLVHKLFDFARVVGVVVYLQKAINYEFYVVFYLFFFTCGCLALLSVGWIVPLILLVDAIRASHVAALLHVPLILLVGAIRASHVAALLHVPLILLVGAVIRASHVTILLHVPLILLVGAVIRASPHVTILLHIPLILLVGAVIHAAAAVKITDGDSHEYQYE
jgi:hypothetical protein